jgi:pimeloyl-ACP methyl ester carboxylesterase
MRETYKRVIEEDLEPLLPLVQASTLLLWGSKDKATPLKDARVMAKKIPNAKLVVLPKAGHFSFLDQPTLAQKALDDFFLS